jgi:ARG/rhodanese/phosphatase superfamily protein
MSPTKWNVLEKLEKVEASAAQSAHGLQMFALKWSCEDGLEYMTLEEALQQGALEVSEVSEDGRVPTLKVINKSARMVFLVAGEELVGGKQNRVLNASMMVAAGGEMLIPVTCVEVGRWGYRSRRFGSGTISSHYNLRRIMSRQVSGSYRAAGAPQSDQGAVWGEVARKMHTMGSNSSSGALHDIYKDFDRKLDQILKSLSVPTGSNGVAFAINGKIAGADFFDKPETLAKLWPKLVKSYAMDALEQPMENPPVLEPERITEWLKAATSARQEWFDSPGVGKDVRIEGEKLTGATLIVEEHPVHLELFREEEAQPPSAEAPPHESPPDPRRGGFWRRLFS